MSDGEYRWEEEVEDEDKEQEEEEEYEEEEEKDEEEEEEKEAEEEEEEETLRILSSSERLADGMDVGVKKLRIAYRFNFWAKTDKPRLLNASKHVKELFDAAHTEMEERNEAKHKNSKSKRKPALQVIISDLRPKQELAKVGKGKGKGKKVTRVSSDSEDEGDAGPKKKSGPSFVRELEAKHKCDQHNGFCSVAQNGEHISLSGHQISLWALLMAEGVHDSITTPPQALKLNVGEGSKAAPVSRRAKDVPPPPQPLDSQEDEDPTLFPKIGDWLLELAEKDEDGHNFLSFGPLLRAQGLMRVSQLVDETSESLKQYCLDILPGTAKLLIKRAKKECRRVRKVEAQRKDEWERDRAMVP
ncbi:hypothetical protein B0H14DRAFT_3518882 [Mycena olivaceomarginata]|nr:hypothetical protein B0H14DRAFT_3518882 [Mycena olivaceomarginata]